jgi:MFS family permease
MKERWFGVFIIAGGFAIGAAIAIFIAPIVGDAVDTFDNTDDISFLLILLIGGVPGLAIGIGNRKFMTQWIYIKIILLTIAWSLSIIFYFLLLFQMAIHFSNNFTLGFPFLLVLLGIASGIITGEIVGFDEKEIHLLTTVVAWMVAMPAFGVLVPVVRAISMYILDEYNISLFVVVILPGFITGFLGGWLMLRSRQVNESTQT